MIWESSHWKDDLQKLASLFDRHIPRTRWPERSLADLEKRVMIAFYCIRKLIEAKKLSDRVATQTLSLRSYPSLGKPVTRLNWHDINSLYDLSRGISTQRPLKFVCDQFIHSYIFVPTFSARGTLTSILFVSDRRRKEALFRLSMRTMLRVLRSVGSDYPRRLHFTFDSAAGDYAVEAWRFRRPRPSRQDLSISPQSAPRLGRGRLPRRPPPRRKKEVMPSGPP